MFPDSFESSENLSSISIYGNNNNIEKPKKNPNPTESHFLGSCLKQCTNPATPSLCKCKNVKTIQVYIFQMLRTCL